MRKDIALAHAEVGVLKETVGVLAYSLESAEKKARLLPRRAALL